MCVCVCVCVCVFVCARAHLCVFVRECGRVWSARDALKSSKRSLHCTECDCKVSLCPNEDSGTALDDKERKKREKKSERYTIFLLQCGVVCSLLLTESPNYVFFVSFCFLPGWGGGGGGGVKHQFTYCFFFCFCFFLFVCFGGRGGGGGAGVATD